MNDTGTSYSLEWYDPISGCWYQSNVEPHSPDHARQIVDTFRNKLGAEDVRYRLITTTNEDM